MVDRRRDPGFPGAVSTTEEGALRLDAVADNPAAAMFANRREPLNGALEAVEHVTRTPRDDLEAEVVIIPAYITFRHDVLPGRSLQ
jgi:hypothetical protein